MKFDKKEINKLLSQSVQADYINEPYNPKKIDITTKQMVLDVIFKRLKNNEIDIETFFQRKSNIWNKVMQSRLIESILIRLPLPAFYFDGSEDNLWLIVDGLQRIITFQNFVIKQNFKLEKLEYLTQFNGYTYDELPRELQRRIEEHEITAYIINPGTPEEVKFNLFLRINTGGIPLNAQEIRHALNQGVATEFIAELCELPEFKRFGFSTKRMEDRDFATRFVAFYIQKPLEYKPDMDTFLNSTMSYLNHLPKKSLNIIKRDFVRSLDASYEIFGDYAFRKRLLLSEKKKMPLNKALFETISSTLAKYNNNQLKLLINQKKQINNDFADINHLKTFVDSITIATSDRKGVYIRFAVIEDLFDAVLENAQEN